MRPEVFGRFARPDRSTFRLQTPFTVDVGPDIKGDEWPLKNEGRNLSITRCAYRGMTQMRFAFENIILKPVKPCFRSRHGKYPARVGRSSGVSPLSHRILRILSKRGRAAPGVFAAGGWRVLRDQKESRNVRTK